MSRPSPSQDFARHINQAKERLFVVVFEKGPMLCLFVWLFVCSVCYFVYLFACFFIVVVSKVLGEPRYFGIGSLFTVITILWKSFFIACYFLPYVFLLCWRGCYVTGLICKWRARAYFVNSKYVFTCSIELSYWTVETWTQQTSWAC